MSKIDFSVIIVSYKKLEVLIECLDSIYKFNDIGERLEVIVVDNSPDNQVFEYVKSNYNKLIVLKNKNRGFGEANNVGAKIARGKFLLFLNPDTIMIEPIFQKAINFFNDSEIGMFGGKLLSRNLSRNMSFYLMDKYGLLPNLIIKFANKLDLFLDGKMFVSGANIFIRNHVFFEAGLFDELIFMYGEEADLTRRVLMLGHKTGYCKDIRIIHLEGQNTNNSEVAIRRRLTSKKYYCSKYGLKFAKKVRNEIFLNYMKIILYFIIDRKKIPHIKKNIDVLNEFTEKYED
jgi:GT2 family glycosyltransferase